ncbi:MAG: NAD(P)H-hydrate epimerase [Rhodobacteraceae bacterium]|nr:NAD(P)H-hydrate epimerase [Paracoccaceae bacterium]
MTELLTAAQMRALEQAAIASGAVTGLELMERAGLGVVEAMFEEWPELRAGTFRALVLCGPGNNGGDGFVVARQLRQRDWDVEVLSWTGGGQPSADSDAMLSRWLDLGFPGAPGRIGDIATALAVQPDVVIDAVLGTGARPGLPPEVAEAFSAMRDWAWASAASRGTTRLVAVDLPSGLGADTGAGIDAFQADLTVTFHRAKLGHHLADGPRRSGRLRVVPIGLDRAVPRVPPGVSLVDRQAVHPDKRRGHKYSHGHALILSGPSGRGGAARLAARGALRIGAGLVTVGCPPDALAENAARLDAVMLHEIDDGARLGEALSDRRIKALCMGPGLGLGKREAELVAKGLSRHLPTDGSVPLRAPGLDDADLELWFRRYGHRPAVVLDADALTLLSRDPALFGALHDKCVLTPHGGEFTRLFPDIAARLAEPATKGPAFSKVDATREAARRAGCTVLFKGPDTVIAEPSGRAAINSAAYDRAAPWLATAGSGDVLAGFITGLMARGFNPFDAACIAAWLHVECARSFGPGLIAEDLPENLPKVFRALGM